MASEVVFELLCADTINYAMQQNHVQPIHRLRIRNTSGQELRHLTLKITSDPAFIVPYTTEIISLKAREKKNMDVKLTQIPSMLFAQTESVHGNLTVALYQGERLVASISHEMTVLAYDEWQGLDIMPEVTAAFVTPNHPYVMELIKRATPALKRLSRGAVFDGYASGTADDIKRQVEAIYNTISTEGLTYQLPPASFGPGQRLRLADTISQNRCGTCIDLTLLMAGCLEAVRLNPLLIFTESHAFIGVWLVSDTFSEALEEDISALSRRTSENVNELLLIEATGVTRRISFDEACKIGVSHLADSLHFRYALDVRRARMAGVSPISLRRYDRKGNLLLPEAQTEKISRAKRKQLAAMANETDPFTTKQHMWERKLLDLSMRNALINFRASRSNVQFLCRDGETIANALTGGGDYSFTACPGGLAKELTRVSGLYPLPQDLPDRFLRTELESKNLCTCLEEKELASSLTNLYRSARTSVEESGANPLYLAVGFLRWYDAERSPKELYAPLVLLPVELSRRVSPRGFVLRLRDEEPQFNITLMELLRTSFDIHLTGLDPLPYTAEGIDMRRIYGIIRRAVATKKRWDVVESACLGNFSFSRFIMWNDLHNRAEELSANRMVTALVNGYADRHDAPLFLTPTELDNQILPADIAAPLPYDSSQLAAIHAAAQGASFVLHGPPGTGKSQTIANMICNALYAGKTVLFIAEKMAALSVVQNRLDKLGLSPFCLELHSDKSKKGDVLRHLSETLEDVHATAPKEYNDESARLLALRRSLGETLSLIHRTHPCGFSLYEIIARFEEYRNAVACDFFTEDHCRSMTPAMWRAWEDLLREYVTLAEGCGGAHNNPLSIYKKTSYSGADKPTLFNALQEHLRLSDDLKRVLATILAVIPARQPLSYIRMVSLCKLCERLSVVSALPAGILTNTATLPGQERISRLCEVGRRHIQLREVLLFRFDEALLTVDPNAAIKNLQDARNASVLLRRGKVKRERDKLAVYAKDPATLTVRDLDTTWQQLKEYKDSIETIRDLIPGARALFGDLIRDEDTDFVYIGRIYRDATDLVALVREVAENAEELSDLLSALDALASRGELLKLSDSLKALCTCFEALTHSEQVVADLTGADTAEWQSMPDWLNAEYTLFERALAHIDALKDYSTYRAKRQEMHATGLGALVTLAEEGTVAPKELFGVFYRAASHALATHIIEEDPRLSGFTGVMMEERIREYTETNEKFSRLTVEELLARLCARVPHADGGADSSEMSILRRAARSGGRGISLRRLFDSIPHLLRRLAPCMLMSPLSVAQYLDPSLPPFDLVIFDEASQMPTCEAVGAIARGEHLVVVGDPKQLPPTTFFTSLHFDEENLDREDLDSLLDDCLAISMPELHLLWHYRSRHESLIAFSNNQYYDGRLFTFPSPENQSSRVSLQYVNGVYDRGRTKQNRLEAEAVVDEVMRRLTTPALRSRSIGIVTFSSVQQLLIEDLLETRLALDPAAEKAASALHEPIFVKNLENVQGDERDVILFSVCYGPDRTGHVGVNFGPLNRDGGWRRLNVAVSRARYEMLVFASLTPEQIDLARTNSLGVAGLRAFLEYARDGRESMPDTAPSGGEGYDIANCIAEILTERGYTCHTHVGSATGRIDVAVYDDEDASEYILGIVCDTPPTDAEETMRDRNILRNDVLGSLGWQIHRIWSVDFWDAPMREVEKIIKTIEAVRITANQKKELKKAASAKPAAKVAVPTKTKNVKSPVKKQPEKIEVPDNGNTETKKTVSKIPVKSKKAAADELELGQVPYKVTRLRAVPEEKRNTDSFASPESFRTILTQVREILATETPISYNLLRRRVTDVWGIRPSPRVDSCLAAALAEMRCVARADGDSTIYWGVGQVPGEYRTWRGGTVQDRREPNDIPMEEIMAACATVVERQLSLSRADVISLVAKGFGHSKQNLALKARIEDAIIHAAARRLLVERGDQLISPNA